MVLTSFFSGVDSCFPEISNMWGPVPKWFGSHLLGFLDFFLIGQFNWTKFI